jgi:uncharacterized protein YegL
MNSNSSKVANEYHSLHQIYSNQVLVMTINSSQYQWVVKWIVKSISSEYQ